MLCRRDAGGMQGRNALAARFGNAKTISAPLSVAKGFVWVLLMLCSFQPIPRKLLDE